MVLHPETMADTAKAIVINQNFIVFPFVPDVGPGANRYRALRVAAGLEQCRKVHGAYVVRAPNRMDHARRCNMRRPQT
jgi:hypothetical protein